jgi:transcriptional regulator with XRE-family HTH domain
VSGIGVARVAANVRRLRKEHGLTQEQLAERCGLAPRKLQAIEAGINVRVSTLDRLAAGLGVDVWELLRPTTG